MSMMSAPTVAPAQTGFVPTAAAGIDQAKAAALAQLAASGKVAQGASANAGTADTAAKTQALKTAMALAAGARAPVGTGQAMQQRVGAEVDPRIAQIGLIGQAYQQAQAAQQGAYGNYMNEVKAGLPVAETALQSTIANDQEKAAAQSQRDALSLALAQMRLQQATVGSPTKAQEAAYGTSTVAPAIADQTLTGAGQVAGGLAAGLSGRANTSPPSQGDVASSLDNSFGLVPGTTSALASANQVKQTNTQQTQTSRELAISRQQAANSSDTAYNKYLAPAVDALAGTNGAKKVDAATLLQTLIKGGVSANEANKIVKGAAAILNTTTP